MKEGCLHCLLIATTEKWLKTHSASTDEILSMVARFVAQVAIERPEHQHFEDAEVVILGIKHSNPRGSLN
jgi:hypothetical protein